MHIHILSRLIQYVFCVFFLNPHNIFLSFLPSFLSVIPSIPSQCHLLVAALIAPFFCCPPLMCVNVCLYVYHMFIVPTEARRGFQELSDSVSHYVVTAN